MTLLSIAAITLGITFISTSSVRYRYMVGPDSIRVVARLLGFIPYGTTTIPFDQVVQAMTSNPLQDPFPMPPAIALLGRVLRWTRVRITTVNHRGLQRVFLLTPKSPEHFLTQIRPLLKGTDNKTL